MRTELSPKEAMRKTIEYALEMLAREKPKIKKVKDIREAINLYPEELQEVALLLATMPVTQVSVERLFSALKLLKSDLRNKLKEDIIADILLMRANL